MAVEQQSETPPPQCPKCAGDMWDNRASKRNPRAPDFKCKDKSCDGVVWPPRENAGAGAPNARAAGSGAAQASTPSAPQGDEPACPVCGGRMWDDRATKRNPRAPDFKCRNKPKFQGGPGCPGVIWPPRDGEQRAASPARGAAPRAAVAPRPASATPEPPPDVLEYRDFSDDELPF